MLNKNVSMDLRSIGAPFLLLLMSLLLTINRAKQILLTIHQLLLLLITELTIHQLLLLITEPTIHQLLLLITEPTPIIIIIDHRAEPRVLLLTINNQPSRLLLLCPKATNKLGLTMFTP